MKTILGIDQSTSATKGVLYQNGTLIDKVSLDHRQIYPQPGWVEHDAEEIWSNVLQVLRTIAERNRERSAEAVCLSITNQRETILVFERGSGRPLHNAIVWQCGRGEPICAQLAKAGHADAVLRRTGLKIDTYFSASKLTWLVRNRPEIKAKLESGEALIGTIDAYLIHRLTGGEVHATDHTNASRTLLFDISKLSWDEELCGLFEVPERALPDVRESAARFGETTIDGLLEKPLPICGVIGDSQASLFAQRCYEPGTVKVTFGTGSSVLLNVGDSFRLPEKGSVSALAWVHEGRPTYALEGLINYSAATISWLRNQLGLIGDAAETETLATSVEDSGGVYMVPAFAGLGAPYWKASAKACICGLTAHSNRNHVVRAALESIAYQIRDVLEMMKSEGDVDLQAIHADGGATVNRFLMQFTADMLGVELRVSDVPEISVLGAVMLGMLGMGIHDSLEELAELPRELSTYRPEMSSQRAEDLYAGWKAAIAQVLSTSVREHRATKP